MGVLGALREQGIWFAAQYFPKYVFSPERGVGTAGQREMQGEQPSTVVTQMGKPALWKYTPCSTNLERDQIQSLENISGY